jgi:hypothetical protein
MIVLEKIEQNHMPFLSSIREMCCVISMLERDAHMNAYQTHVEVLIKCTYM